MSILKIGLIQDYVKHVSLLTTMTKTIELDDHQIHLLIKTLLDQKNNLDVLLKNQDGLEAETIRDMLIEHRELNNIIRELQFFAINK